MREPRKLLGRSRAFGSLSAIYQVEDGLEIEAHEQYYVVQRHVLFDDVLLVTIHRETGALYLILTGLLSLFFFGIAGTILSTNVDIAWAFAAVSAALGAPVFVLFLTRVFLGVDVVTVFGRRSKADLRFGIRKKRAREVYGTICAAVRHAQRRAT
jgi:hypothetical protein